MWRMDTFGLVVALSLLAISMLFFGRRLYQDRGRLGTSMITRLLLGATLALIVVVSVLIKPHFWWLYTIGMLAKQFGMLLAYYSIDQLLNNRPSLPILRTRMFAATTVLSLITVVLNYMRREHITIIIENVPFGPGWPAYCAELLHHFIIGYVCLLIVWLYWTDIWRHTEPLYTVRRFIGMLAFFTCAVMSFAAVLNVVVSVILRTANPQLSLNHVYNLGRPIFFMCLVLGLVVPQRTYARLAAPLKRTLAKRQQQQQELLAYLHEAMLCIVPDVRLPNAGQHPLRLLIEISDAREMIWSWVQHDQPISIQSEARYLRQLLESKIVIREPGAHLPPPLLSRDVVTHNLAVAELLRRSESVECSSRPPSRWSRATHALAALLQR